jgi:hypothetical protein
MSQGPKSSVNILLERKRFVYSKVVSPPQRLEKLSAHQSDVRDQIRELQEAKQQIDKSRAETKTWFQRNPQLRRSATFLEKRDVIAEQQALYHEREAHVLSNLRKHYGMQNLDVDATLAELKWNREGFHFVSQHKLENAYKNDPTLRDLMARREALSRQLPPSTVPLETENEQLRIRQSRGDLALAQKRATTEMNINDIATPHGSFLGKYNGSDDDEF